MRPHWDGPTTLEQGDPAAPWDLVLLDRDGTLNVRVEGDYVRSPEQLRLLPGVADAVGLLAAARVPAVVVTNQRGIARGLMDHRDLTAVHQRLRADLAEGGGSLAAVVTCPHDVGECRCRKPADGLYREVLARAPWARPERCLMIGDMPSDVAPALGLGMAADQLGATWTLADALSRALARAPSGAPGGGDTQHRVSAGGAPCGADPVR